MNPLMPGVGDVLIATLVLLNATLVLLALVCLLRSTDKSRWVGIVLVTCLVPIAGPIASLVTLHRRSARETITVERTVVSS